MDFKSKGRSFLFSTLLWRNTDTEMNPNVLFAFDRMPVLHRRKETPVVKRFQQ
jgi:hypothetical protein